MALTAKQVSLGFGVPNRKSGQEVAKIKNIQQKRKE
jgi:hypothetical protein